ncbi:MAG: 50S ribosomal protein L15 [Paracoccaceae bacterium]|nr:50S ribosomal protein L15 [Paracoccaceae bacterium]
MKIHELSDNPGARTARKRVGRGPGSGTGSLGGRGMNGQKSRSGVAIKGFEGGQMPLHRRLPKRGFNNIFAKRYAVVNLGNIQKFIDAGKLDPKATIDEAALVQSGMVRRLHDGVRVLAKGELKAAGIKIEVTGASKSAVAAVEAAKGSLTTRAPAATEEPAPKAEADAEG